MSRQNNLIINQKVNSPMAEAYRSFLTNIKYAKFDGELKSILFTSTGANEGKSLTAANIAVAIARTGDQAVILDCDLRKPVQHLIFGKKAEGLSNVLSGRGTISSYFQYTDIPNLRLIASGPVPTNPSELLRSRKMSEILSFLRNQADYLIIDTPPVLPVTDACILGSHVDGIVLVLGAGMVKPEAAKRAKETIAAAHGNILGIMVNRVIGEDVIDDYYSYYGNS